MNLWWVVPENMGAVGTYALIAAYVLVFFLPKNSKAAIICAVIGGFGVGGVAAGWFGQFLVETGQKAASFSQRFTASAFGAAIAAVPFIILLIFLKKFIGKGGSGLETKGKGMFLKMKHALWITGFALLGCAIAAVPLVYGYADDGVAALAGFVNSWHD